MEFLLYHMMIIKNGAIESTEEMGLNGLDFFPLNHFFSSSQSLPSCSRFLQAVFKKFKGPG